MPIRIVRLSRPGQFAGSVRVQKSAWGQDDSGTIPAHLLIAAQHHWGLVLGAYDGRKMVGILFGITALENGRPYHYSHITGVAKGYQSKGVGFKLKLAQREHLIKSGQSLVKWTYDPLQAGNAYFNIRKLGAICHTYRRNLYGPLEDSLNRGRPTDRFEVEWRIKSKRVRERIRGYRPASLAEILAEGAEPVNRTKNARHDQCLPVSARLGLGGPRLLVEIPRRIGMVRDVSLGASNSWTLHARRIFENYFARGFSVTDVIVDNDEDRIFYLLERPSG
jgi:predicted GNAT superfamily acetyltransferase